MHTPEPVRTSPVDTLRARRVALPGAVRVAPLYPGAYLADAYAIGLPPGVTGDALQFARCVLERQAPWVDRLMWLRDRLVAGFGIKTAESLRSKVEPGAPRIGLFRIYETHPEEVVLGEDDSHLDFRVSVFLPPAAADGTREVVTVTVVHCHNLVGRSYIRLIDPFHRLVVRSGLERAARAGWAMPAATP
jgi:hypothetical protein